MAGNNDPASGAGYVTRLRATRRLIDELEDCLKVAKAPAGHPLQKALADRNFAGSQSAWSAALFRLGELPIIRLKPERDGRNLARYLPTPDTTDVHRMENNLQRYNAFLSDHWTDLLIPDDEFLALQHTSRGQPDKYFGDPGRPVEPDLIFRRRLHRVFNDGTLDHGGRLYGGWWQNIPGRYREAITINWGTTVEIDYSSLHANMLYALEGKEAPHHAYALDGFPNEHRNLLKTAFQKLINARGRIQAPRAETLPEGWTWKQVLDGLRERHEPISKHFQSGIGLKLQRLDSDIAELVMMTMMDKGLLVLPVHDSFVVWDTKEDLLRDVMQAAYFDIMQQKIGVKAEAPWIRKNLSADAHELHEAGVYHFEESIFDYSDRPEYAAYNQRRRDFLAICGEDWGHRHSFYPG